MSKHTPTPWRYNEKYDQSDTLFFGSCGEKVIAFDAGDYDTEATCTCSDADAAYIVKAVNMHDEIVRLLEDIELLVRINAPMTDEDHMHQRIKKLIAKAKDTP